MNLQNIKCPICGKKNTWRDENSFKPFCSDRCKLIDLGEWANESRAIPGTVNSGISPENSEDLDDHF